MKPRTRTLPYVVATLFAAGLLAFAPTAAENPYAKVDEAWISISGTVDVVHRDSFVLDYGDGVVTVEMDDGDRDADGYKLVKGDKVTVNGKVDDDMFETTTIEASSVYVESIGTYFYADASDEEDVTPFVTYWGPVEISSVTFQGIVTDVGNDEFTLNTGARSIRVEVEEMPFDPLDDEGYLKIDVGDRVSVTGTMDSDLFEGRELVAGSIVDLVG